MSLKCYIMAMLLIVWLLFFIYINYNLRSSSQLLLKPYNATKTKKTLGDRAFQVASPGLWNGLPNDIRNAKTMDVFKS